jgi:hypothetical protein
VGAQSEVRAKGTGIRSSCDFISQRHGAATLSAIVARLPEDLREIWPNPLHSAWYPARFHGAVWTGLAREVGGDHAALTSLFQELGRYIADDNLSNVYRAMLASESPDTLLGITPRLWYTYFDGIRVVAEREAGMPRGTMTVEGLVEVAYMAPVSMGWLTRAFERAGARTIEILERNWMEGREASDRLVFDVRWG